MDLCFKNFLWSESWGQIAVSSAHMIPTEPVSTQMPLESKFSKVSRGVVPGFGCFMGDLAVILNNAGVSLGWEY